MASGLDKINAALAKHKTDVLFTIAALARGQGLWQSIANTVKDIAVWKMVGPLGEVLGAVSRITTGFRAILGATGSLEAGLRRLSLVRGLELQFEAITRNASEACARFQQGRFRMFLLLKLFATGYSKVTQSPRNMSGITNREDLQTASGQPCAFPWI